jgi:hypothetical protein
MSRRRSSMPPVAAGNARAASSAARTAAASPSAGDQLDQRRLQGGKLRGAAVHHPARGQLGDAGGHRVGQQLWLLLVGARRRPGQQSREGAERIVDRGLAGPARRRRVDEQQPGVAGL